MKQVLHLCSKIRGLFLASQCSDVGYDCRSTVVRPSFDCRSTMLKLCSVLAILFIVGVGQMWATTTYKLTAVTSVSAGNKYVFVRNSRALINTVSSKALQTTDTYNTTSLAGNEAYVWTLETATNGFYIKSCKDSKYLKKGSDNTEIALADDSGGDWTINFTDGVALISNTSASNRFLGETSSGSNVYKGYATSNLGSYGHDFTVYRLDEESSCSGTKLGTPVVTATPSSGQIILTWPAVSNASSYQLKWNGGDWASATSPVTKTGLTNGTSYSYQVKAIGNGTTYCDGDASASASAIPGTYYTVTWKASGSPDVTTSVRSGTKPVFPSTPSSCDGTSTSFYGWSTSTWNGKTDDISDKTIYTSADDMPNVSGAVTYYAVFAKAGAANTYVKGTSSDLTDGQTVLIVNTANNVAIKGASSAKEALSVSIVSNKITTDNTYVLWTVEPHGSGYYLKYSGNYLNGYYGSLYIDSYKDEWVLSGSGPYVLNSTLDSGSKLKCNGSSAFTVGTGTGTEYNMDFFIPETASQFLTTCCTELGSINGSFSLTTKISMTKLTK